MSLPVQVNITVDESDMQYVMSVSEVTEEYEVKEIVISFEHD